MGSGLDDELCEWLELYALDGLEAHEKVAFEYHLTQCALCRNLYRELKPVVELLPLASEPVPVPEKMRERVLGSVIGRAEEGQMGQVSVSAGAQTNLYTGAESNSGGSPSSLSRKAAHSREISGSRTFKADEHSRRAVKSERAGQRTVYLRWISAGLCAAVLGLGFYAFRFKEQAGELQARLAAADQELANAGMELAKANSNLVLIKKPAEGLKADWVVSLIPASEQFVSKGLVTIAADAKGAHLILQAEDLPQIKENEAFQVWLFKDNQPINAGSFYPHDGKGAIHFTFEPKEYDIVTVTIEPDAHGDKPRGTTVMTASLKS